MPVVGGWYTSGVCAEGVVMASGMAVVAVVERSDGRSCRSCSGGFGWPCSRGETEGTDIPRGCPMVRCLTSLAPDENVRFIATVISALVPLRTVSPPPHV